MIRTVEICTVCLTYLRFWELILIEYIHRSIDRFDFFLNYKENYKAIVKKTLPTNWKLIEIKKLFYNIKNILF